MGRKRGPRESAAPPAHELARVIAELQGCPGVLGVYVGTKTRRGRKTRRLSVVCLVRKKRARLTRRERIPRTVSWVVGRKRARSMATDVQELVTPFKRAAMVWGPGDGLSCSGARSTVGIALRHERLGAVVTTAGHGVLSAGEQIHRRVTFSPGERRVQLRQGGGGPDSIGDVLQAVVTETQDYAYVAPIAGSVGCANLFREWRQVGPPYLVTDVSIGKPAFFLSTGQIVATVIAGTDARLSFSDGSSMISLLLTEHVSSAGHSGGLLVDEDFRAIGLLVGHGYVNGNHYSAYMQASALWDGIEPITFA